MNLRYARRALISAVVIVLLVVLYRAGEDSRRNFEQGTNNTICMLTERC